ncbi:hypothetical protein D3Z60_22710 [Lachnospiraceae bacterium]|nr:hypothetical protein [Lachnospiraceae bacterium]
MRLWTKTEIGQHIGYIGIIFTPYSAEEHNALPLWSARRRGAAAADKRNETFLRAGSYYQQMAGSINLWRRT